MKTRKLNRIALFLAILFSAPLFGSQQEVKQFTYTDSWGSPGYSVKEQSSEKVVLNYSVGSFSLEALDLEGETMYNVSLPGSFLFNDEGAPNLPGMGRYLAVPNGAKAVLQVRSVRYETIKDVSIAPAPRIPWDTETGPLEYSKDMTIYGKAGWYPSEPVRLSEPSEIRGVTSVILGITPFQYNPVSRELKVLRDIEVEVTFEGGTGSFGQDRLRSRWWDAIFADLYLNYSSLPKKNYTKGGQGTKETGCDYLIVTPTNAEFQQWADSLKKFRTRQGILTDVMTVEECGGNTVSSLESFFNNAYNTWDIVPSAVLILGDYGSNSATSITSPIWNNYCVSDNIWADVTGNSMPDIIFARMTAQNAAQLETMVTKVLDYERTPPTDPDFYDHPVTALGFQTERWFQICSEAVAGFWENELGKNTVRVNKTYIGNPTSDPWSTATNTSTVVNYFGPNGLGYIPATPGQVNCSWNGSAQDVINAINGGAFMLQHRDHGYEQGWGEPDFSSSNINSLNNEDLTFVWSINCLTGKYNYSSEVFAEKFHRHTANGHNSGALGINAASEVSYSFVNDTYVWGAYDNMWPEFMPDYGTAVDHLGIYPAFASAAGKYFLQASNWPYNTNNKEVTYNLFHHHGDAFMTVYSEVPELLTVQHNPILYAGVTSFDVTANAGSLICLTVNDEIIGVAEGTGAPVSIPIPGQVPPDQVLVTVTLQNYYRYEATVEVIPPTGPYVVYNAVEINDASGNNNGIMETGESILASLTVENVGVEPGENVMVTLSTADEYVTLTDDTEDFGTIPAGATAVSTDGFAWEVADNIPDLHQVIFEVNATNGSETWTSYFGVQGHGPNLEVGDMTIDDASGNNNGRLDPGETVTISIETANTGSFHAIGAMGYLSASSGYVTIINDTYDFNVIGSGQSESAEFEIEVSSSAPVGTAFSFVYDVVSGGYTVQESFGATIGLIVEDWETGDMSQYDWQTGGNGNWFVTSSVSFEGTYSAESANINDNQSTWLSLEYECFSDDVISFWYKVSSESNYDYLKFYIDNSLMDSWSGEIGWTEAEYPVTAGVHTFKWEYDKDMSVSSGNDCAWIDFIILPPPPVTTAYAGPDDEICGDEPYQTQGGATLYNVVYWSTSGSGSFDDPQSLTAIYTPSQEDVDNGGVTLTLTAYYSGGTQVSDDMYLSIAQPPVAFAGEDATACFGSGFLLEEAMAENSESVIWTTTGDGTFDDNTVVNPVYTPGEGDLSNGSVTLTMEVQGSLACGSVFDDIVLSVIEAPEAEAGSEQTTCSDTPVTLSDATATNYASLQWNTSGDGSFSDPTVLNPEYMPGVEDAVNGSVILTLTAESEGNCTPAESSVTITVVPAAVVSAGEDQSITEDQTLQISGAVADNTTSVLWSTSGDGTFDDNTLLNTVYTPGEGDIAAQQVTLTLTGTGNEPCGETSDEMVLTISALGINQPGAPDIRVWPNPNNGSFVVTLSGKETGNTELSLISPEGKVLYSKRINVTSAEYQIPVDLNLEKGIYYLRIAGERYLVTRKLTVQ